MTALSILELVRVTEDTDARGALDNARDLAAHAENWGYRRIWVAEHHNMPGIASAATSVVLGHIAAGTKNIRVGAGSIMLPDHAPYVIAEQSGFWRDCFRAASTSGWAAPRAPTGSRCAPCAARPKRPRISRRRSRAAGIPGSGRSKPAYPGSAGCGNGSAVVDTRIEQFRSDARGRARPALCLRLAFRARGRGRRILTTAARSSCR